jgi:hypothetical protein
MVPIDSTKEDELPERTPELAGEFAVAVSDTLTEWSTAADERACADL